MAVMAGPGVVRAVAASAMVVAMVEIFSVVASPVILLCASFHI
jgi:hypothetical protein